MDLRNSRTVVLIVYAMVMLTRGTIGYSLKESSYMSTATYNNLYYLDEGITSAIVLLADRKNLTRIFLGISAAVHGYLMLTQALAIFPATLLSLKIGDMIVNTDCCLFLVAYLLLFNKEDKGS